MEREGFKTRANSGVLGGAIVQSDWKTSYAKNEGKSNSTTAEEQADREIKSIYRQKLEQKYSETPESAGRRNFQEPQLANKFDKAKFIKRKMFFWKTQPKLDGIRSVIDHNSALSRAGKPFYTADHIIEEIRDLTEKENITLDGELYNHEFKDDFEQLSSFIKKQKISSIPEPTLEEIREKVQFHIYDVIVHDHPDMSFDERESYLIEVFTKYNIPMKTVRLVKSETISIDIEDPEIIHERYLEAGYEGMMFRNPFAPYTFGRSDNLLKHKTFIDAEMKILEINEGKGNWEGIAKSAKVRTPKGTISKSGIKGTKDFLKKIFESRDEIINTEATVKFQGYTSADALRFGVIKKFHFGKRME
jgi:ATP-dependent DNA ligase